MMADIVQCHMALSIAYYAKNDVAASAHDMILYDILNV